MACSFSYSLDSYVYDDDLYDENGVQVAEDIEVTYVVEGSYTPAIPGTFNKNASDDIEYYGIPEEWNWELIKVINRTDNRKILDRWIRESDIHELIVDAFEKEHLKC